MIDLNIRKAEERDIAAIMRLLSQVEELHAKIRPDVFISGMQKYTDLELKDIIKNELTPVYVACSDSGEVLGHLFCVIRLPKRMHVSKTLYVDDLCVDEASRGNGTGKALFSFAKKLAKELECGALVLNVWEGNDGAKAFYKKMGMSVRETQMELPIM